MVFKLKKVLKILKKRVIVSLLTGFEKKTSKKRWIPLPPPPGHKISPTSSLSLFLSLNWLSLSFSSFFFSISFFIEKLSVPSTYTAVALVSYILWQERTKQNRRLSASALSFVPDIFKYRQGQQKKGWKMKARENVQFWEYEIKEQKRGEKGNYDDWFDARLHDV